MGRKFDRVSLLKKVFEPLIQDDCFQKKGDGFIEIPAFLYPITTHCLLKKEVEIEGEKRLAALDSFNPFYKINIFGLLKNTHKKNSIVVPKKEFFEYVLPEYLFFKKNTHTFS